MKSVKLLLVPALSTALLCGCVSRSGDEYTGGGTVGGAAIGAATGAIIGNEFGHPAQGAVIGGAVGATAGTLYEAELSRMRKREYEVQGDNIHFWNQRALQNRNDQQPEW